MKNSTAIQISSQFPKNLADQDLLKDLQKSARKSDRWITCQLCGKTITRKSMTKHFMSFHNSDLGAQK